MRIHLQTTKAGDLVVCLVEPNGGSAVFRASGDIAKEVAERIGCKHFVDAAYAEQLTNDAENWGDALNEAGWAYAKAFTMMMNEPMSGRHFNLGKGILREAIFAYIEHVKKINGASVGQDSGGQMASGDAEPRITAAVTHPSSTPNLRVEPPVPPHPSFLAKPDEPAYCQRCGDHWVKHHHKPPEPFCVRNGVGSGKEGT